MKITGKEDLRIQKTMAGIHTAFEEMICEMDYDSITVKELCARAMINKKTFYRYYECLDDLLMEYQEDISNDYLKRVRGLSIPDDLEQITREFSRIRQRQAPEAHRRTVRHHAAGSSPPVAVLSHARHTLSFFATKRGGESGFTESVACPPHKPSERRSDFLAVPREETRHLCKAHSSKNHNHAQPLGNAKRLAEHDHGDEEAGGKLRSGHNGREPGGKVRGA